MSWDEELRPRIRRRHQVRICFGASAGLGFGASQSGNHVRALSESSKIMAQFPK